MKTITLLLSLLISGSLFAFNFASPSEPSAKIVMDHSSTAKQQFPVKLLMVNGENVTARNGAVWLQPGEYELKFSASLNADYTKRLTSLKERRHFKNSNTLKLSVEADKSYYVAYDASATDITNWGPVVYRIK